jgi:SAM-dependent methyltransferase
MWAVIVKRQQIDKRPILRLSCHVERARLPALTASLAAEGYLDGAMARAMLEVDAAIDAAPSAYLTFQPGAPRICALDFASPRERPSVRYLKWRPTPHGASWSAYRPLAEALPQARLDSLCEAPPPDVAGYYDANCSLILRDVGATYQAALLPGDPALTVLGLAREAGVEAGMRILDAGCGVGGPALIMASAIPDLQVDAVTNSARQAEEARASVAAQGLGDRVHPVQGDYHALPYGSCTFDRVLFLESFGYAADLARLAGEAHRVLKPGGMVFIKDAFRKADPLAPAERLELAEFNRVYAFSAPTVDRAREALQGAGLVEVVEGPLDPSYDLERFYGAMGVTATPRPIQVTEFGRLHYRRFEHLPVAFHRIAARKP